MYYFIINPTSKSGLGKQIWSQLKTMLDRQEIDYEFYYSKYPFHATKLVREILSYEGEKHIVVIGGDGTLNEAANGFTSYDNASLSYIPSGSGNDFAKALHLVGSPLSLLSSILTSDSISHYDQGVCELPKAAQTDDPFVGNRRFVISAGIGFDASICYEALHSRMKGWLNRIGLGKLTYVLIALKQIAACPLVDATVTIDGKELRTYRRIFFIAAMNQPFEGGGFRMVPSTNATDGKLSVAVFYNLSKPRALMMLPLVLFGTHTNKKGFDSFTCKTVKIETRQPLTIHTDGEYAGTSDTVSFSIHPESIRYLR
ncbi:MAG: hypothetical protein PWP24_1856 [Clostridiales bacterium]|nr:hypothetical protein [Clostridiales bacterium]